MVNEKVKLKKTSKHKNIVHILFSKCLLRLPSSVMYFPLSVHFATRSFFLTSILHSDFPQGVMVLGLQISLQTIRREQINE